MAHDVGVLVGGKIFQDCLKGRSPYESFALYDFFGKKEGFQPIFFTLDRVSFKRLTVQGVIRNEKDGYTLRQFPIPSIIHNRIKTFMKKDLQLLAQLRKINHTIVFNRDNRMDKWNVHRKLRNEPSLSAHLPETNFYSPQALKRMVSSHRCIYVKPTNRSLAMGLFKLEQKEKKVLISSPKWTKSREVPLTQLPAKMAALTRGSSRNLVQEGISLAKINGKPFDLRVSVQRAGTGEWRVSGIVAKVGYVGAVATNVAVGGKPRKFDLVLNDLGWKEKRKLIDEIERVSLQTARTLSKEWPGLADLGLDIGVDHERRVWIIEVNARDLRITFRQAEDWNSWKQTFGSPMQYASFLLKKKVRPKIKELPF